jgi:hypothetical protein
MFHKCTAALFIVGAMLLFYTQPAHDGSSVLLCVREGLLQSWHVTINNVWNHPNCLVGLIQ